MQGGTLEFHMTGKPSKWGIKEGQEPRTSIEDYQIIPVPFIAKGDVAFKGETEVVLKNADQEASIYYRLNKDDFLLYENPFTISEPATLEVYSEKNKKQSAHISTQFYKIDPNVSVQLDTEYANQYNGGGNNALIDGIYGTQDFRTGTWQGYFDKDLISTLDLGSKKTVNSVTVNFLQDQRSWIFYPTEVACFGSTDGINFIAIDKPIKIDTTIPSEDSKIKTLAFEIPNTNYRYIKIIAKKLGVLPEWHLGYAHDGRSWLFVDEISIK